MDRFSSNKGNSSSSNRRSYNPMRFFSDSSSLDKQLKRYRSSNDHTNQQKLFTSLDSQKQLEFFKELNLRERLELLRGLNSQNRRELLRGLDSQKQLEFFTDLESLGESDLKRRQQLFNELDDQKQHEIFKCLDDAERRELFKSFDSQKGLELLEVLDNKKGPELLVNELRSQERYGFFNVLDVRDQERIITCFAEKITCFAEKLDKYSKNPDCQDKLFQDKLLMSGAQELVNLLQLRSINLKREGMTLTPVNLALHIIPDLLSNQAMQNVFERLEKQKSQNELYLLKNQAMQEIVKKS